MGKFQMMESIGREGLRQAVWDRPWNSGYIGWKSNKYVVYVNEDSNVAKIFIDCITLKNLNQWWCIMNALPKFHKLEKGINKDIVLINLPVSRPDAMDQSLPKWKVYLQYK